RGTLGSSARKSRDRERREFGDGGRQRRGLGQRIWRSDGGRNRWREREQGHWQSRAKRKRAATSLELVEAASKKMGVATMVKGSPPATSRLIGEEDELLCNYSKVW
ncbi:hypothetical protein LINPERHAP2_LOCUS33063, partial [Linum perenne]